jgi:hypothetical protein
MPKWALIVGCSVFLFLAIVLLTLPRKQGAKYRAEVLVVMRPFNYAVLRPAFERQIIKASPGVSRLAFQFSTYRSTRTGLIPRLLDNVAGQSARQSARQSG